MPARVSKLTATAAVAACLAAGGDVGALTGAALARVWTKQPGRVGRMGLAVAVHPSLVLVPVVRHVGG